MKKIKLVIFLSLLTVFMLLLTSCELLPTDWFNFRSLKKPESAEEVYERMNEALAEEDSYQLDSTVKMTIYIDGERYDTQSTGKEIFINADEGEEYFYREITSSIEHSGEEVGEPITSIEAYYDGKAFVRYYGDVEQSFYSPMSSETFYECFISSDDDVIENEEFLVCSSKRFKELEGGGWEIKCSGYSDTFIKDLSDTMGIEGEYDISNAVITLRCDKKFLPTEFNVKVLFDVKDDQTAIPSLEYNGIYSQFGTVEPITAHFNVEDYTKVDDLHMLYEIEDMLEAREDAEEGFFTLDAETVVNIGAGQIVTVECHEVDYGVKKNGDYYYTINYDISGSTGVSRYPKSESFEKDDESARKLINSLINVAGYERVRVSKITESTSGVYKVEIDYPNEQTYNNFLNAYGITYSTCTGQKIFYTIEEGKIVNISSYIVIEGLYGGRYIDIAISTDVNFKPLSERDPHQAM